MEPIVRAIIEASERRWADYRAIRHLDPDAEGEGFLKLGPEFPHEVSE
jgi:hypothetical protein